LLITYNWEKKWEKKNGKNIGEKQEKSSAHTLLTNMANVGTDLTPDIIIGRSLHSKAM
jgi:hypothetical protein